MLLHTQYEYKFPAISINKKMLDKFYSIAMGIIPRNKYGDINKDLIYIYDGVRTHNLIILGYHLGRLMQTAKELQLKGKISYNDFDILEKLSIQIKNGNPDKFNKILKSNNIEVK